jgi:hypothetical protein
MLSDDLSLAYLEDLKAPRNTPGRGKRQVALKKGDSLSGFVLKEIETDKITMVRGEEKLIVAMNDPQKAKAREVAAATTAAPPKQPQATPAATPAQKQRESRRSAALSQAPAKPLASAPQAAQSPAAAAPLPTRNIKQAPAPPDLPSNVSLPDGRQPGGFLGLGR